METEYLNMYTIDIVFGLQQLVNVCIVNMPIRIATESTCMHSRYFIDRVDDKYVHKIALCGHKIYVYA